MVAAITWWWVQPASISNLVLLTKEECDKWESGVPFKGVDMEKMKQTVEERLQKVKDGQLTCESSAQPG